MSMIHARELTRHFRVKQETVEAVRRITIEVQAGEMVALFAGNLSHPSVLVGWFAAAVVAALGLLMGVRGMKQAAD